MDFQSLVERKLEPTGKMNEDIIYRCPRCEGVDGSGHLYVNYRKGKYNCFKCELGGNKIEGLLKILNINLDYDYSKLYNEQEKEINSILSMKKKKVDTRISDYSTNLNTLTQYYAMHTMPLSQVAYNYLINRGLSPYLIDKLCIREGVNRYGESILINNQKLQGRDYSGRIIVPSLRRDGLISFYVARDYIGDKQAKYLNPPKELAVASEDVWNLEMVESDSVIICEGVFTAIAASPMKLNSVATYGKSIAESANSDGIRTTSQGEKLLSKNFKNYYIVYDADALDEAIKSCDYLYDRGANVYLVRINPEIYGKKADVADIGYEEFLKLMSHSIQYKGRLSLL